MFLIRRDVGVDISKAGLGYIYAYGGVRSTEGANPASAGINRSVDGQTWLRVP